MLLVLGHALSTVALSCDSVDDDCRELTPTECARAERCVTIHAAPFDQACLGPSQAAGCMDAEAVCGEAETIARDRDGRQWWLPDTCIPSGWVEIDSRSAPPCDSAAP